MSRFPEQLDHVPAEQRLPEAIGLGFGGVAIGGTLIFIAYLLELATQGFKQERAMWGGGALVVAAACAWFEFSRRRAPLTLVPMGEEVGAYRGGKFVQSFTRGQTTHYQLSWVNTLREVAGIGMFAVALSLGTLSFFAKLKLTVGVAWMVGGAIAADLLLYSSVLTRILSKQYYLPNAVAKGTVAFTKNSLTRFGW